MTSLELLAALEKRYNLGHHRLDTLASAIMAAINSEFSQNNSRLLVLQSLATSLGISLDPLDTFADRAREAIKAHAEDLAPLAHEVHAMLPDGYKGPLPAERYAPIELLEDVRGYLRDYGQDGDLPGPLMAAPLRALCARYSVPMAPLDSLAKRLLDHVAQMEADAAEAHSAAKALGVEVKDLADVTKTLRRAEAIATDNANTWKQALQGLGTLVKDIRTIAEIPDGEDVLARMREVARQRNDYRAEANAARDHLAMVEAKLQAINEALPADLRHTDDLAAAVRSLVLTAETRYGQWDELARETAPAVQTVAALRHALESPHLCLALARELYDADDNLLALLKDAHRPSLAETLMATLATSRAPQTEYPPLPNPSALARPLEGPACVAYYGHMTRPGRIEAIGDDLLRFHPVEGNPVTLNATRRDLEVYHLTADELAAEIARAEARKAPPTESPPAAVADDDIPW